MDFFSPKIWFYLKEVSEDSFPNRSSYLELLSNILKEYSLTRSFCIDVWLINEHQSLMISLFQLSKYLLVFLLLTFGDHNLYILITYQRRISISPCWCHQCRSSRQRYSVKKVVLKNFRIQYSQENTCVEVSFLIKLQFYFIKERHRCFPVNTAKFLRTPIFKNICEWLLLSIAFKLVSNELKNQVQISKKRCVGNYCTCYIMPIFSFISHILQYLFMQDL